VTVRAKAEVEEENASLAAHVPAVITITVARSTAELDRLLTRLRTLLIAVCGAAMAALLGISAWVIRQGLRPVRRLAGYISEIGAHDLGERLALADVPVELVPVVTRLNDLLARLQAAFDRERCFTSDAAHELRTPLSGISAALEICSREKRDVERYDRVIRDCLGVTRQMQTVIDNLLLLARADADRIPISSESVDLGASIREQWRRFEGIARSRRLLATVELPDGLIVQTDSQKLAIIVGNLLENAVHYADDSGQVRITATCRDRSAVVSVANSGSRVRPEDSQRVFDRFWRGDVARSSAARNCGLGLAVCKKLAEALKADLHARSSADGWFLIELELRSAVELDRRPQPTIREQPAVSSR
jgi:two-component system OmpR family sensor kinase